MSRRVQCKEEDCDLFVEVEVDEIPGNFLIFKATLGNFSEEAISKMKDNPLFSPLEINPRPKEFIILNEQLLPDQLEIFNDAMESLKTSDFIFKRNKKKKEVVLYVTCDDNHTHPYKTNL